MKRAKIHISNMISYYRDNVKELSFNRLLTDKYIRDKYNAATFMCLKYGNTILDIEFDSSK